MKVLQINTVFETGSTGRIAYDLANAINMNGDECFVAYGQGHTTYEKSFKIGTKLENHFHNLFSRLFDKQGLYTKKGTNKLIQYIKLIKPDIIHLHNLHGNYLNIEILFNYLETADVPVVWTLHDCWPFTGHCAYFDFINCNKWMVECSICPSIHSYPTSFFIDNSKTNYSIKKFLFNKITKLTIVTPSLWLKTAANQSFLKKFETKVINNGINTDIFKPRDVNTLRQKLDLGDKIILLGVSAEGFEGRKGLKYFIELIDALNDSFKLILIGVKNNELEKIPKKVVTITRTNNTNELAEYYSLADIFLNPTLEDNFPTTNLEALACGTPIITFNTGGSPEVIDKNTGKVVEKTNGIAFLNAVIEMNSQFKLNNTLLCREKAIVKYDKTVMYQEYLHLYQQKRK